MSVCVRPTDAGQSHPLGSVASGAGAVVAAPRVLTHLVVPAQVGAVPALVQVCSKNTNHMWPSLSVNVYLETTRRHISNDPIVLVRSSGSMHWVPVVVGG